MELAKTASYEHGIAYGLLKQFESYRAQIEQYACIAHYCPIPVFVTSHDGLSILYVNPAYIKLTGCDVTQLQDKAWVSVIHPEDQARSVATWDAFIKDRHTVLIREKFVNAQTGDVYQCFVTVHAVPNNGMVGFIFPEHWKPDEGMFRLVPPEGLSPST